MGNTIANATHQAYDLGSGNRGCVAPSSSGTTDAARLFTLDINGNGGVVGENVADSSGLLSGNDVFTGTAGRTLYSDDIQYDGHNVIKTGVLTGHNGFGQIGGVIDFLSHPNANYLYRGDEYWVRNRIYLPAGFEYNQNGRNKYFRTRTHHPDGTSHGYIDLYIDGQPIGGTPWDFIYEGVQSWFAVGDSGDALTLGAWHTVEMHVRLDHLKGSEGGDALVRIWFDDRLIGETTERNTLVHTDDEVRSFYYFTYWGNAGAHKDIDIYFDQLEITSEQPSNIDAAGNHYLGVNGGAV